MEVQIKVNKDFEKSLKVLSDKYGEDFELLNGFHESQLNNSDFIDGFIDKKVADVTIDANANASHKDIRSLMNEKGKPQDKLMAYSKIFYEMKKRWDLKTAREWLETEYNGGFYLHDAPTSTFLPYCFSGETTVLTKGGIKRLDELVGQDIKVLNKDHDWENATVKNFGENSLLKLTLERYGVTKEIYTTSNHVWFVYDRESGETKELQTNELRSGMKIPFNTSKTWASISPSPFGVAHGFYLGDSDKGMHHRANFCGDKEALIPYFAPFKVSGSEMEKATEGIPNYFLEFPALDENLQYLYGWLSGYFAADGCVDEQGRCTISSVKRENLEHVRNVLCVLGMPVNEIRYQDRINNLTGEMGRVYILSLSSEYLREDFFIRPTHKARFVATKERKNRCWNVVGVEKTDRVEDTFCVVAPQTESFTLDNNVLTHNCYAYDLTRLATEGLFFLDEYNNKPPKHLTTFLDDLIEYISFMCNRSSGAVGIPNVLIWTYYFWKHDCETGYFIRDKDYYLKQCFQKLIYRLNQPFMRIDQAAFLNVSIFDRHYIESLFGAVQFPDGTYVIDCIDEIIEHQKVFMEVVSEIRSENMFTFPVLTYSLLKRKGITEEETAEMIKNRSYNVFVDSEFARWCSDHNTTWNDSNFFISDDVTTLSNCCRLLSDTTKLSGFINSIGGTALSIGSVKVNTINLMRIALESECNEKKYLALLRKRTELCCKTLETVRHIIKRNTEKGLLPNYQEGAVEMDKQYCTIGILGLYEVVEAFGYTETDEFGNVSYTDKGIELADKIFAVLNDVKDNFTNDFSFNIESVPAERAAVILCQKDNLLYSLKDKFIYSNQWIPLSEKCTLKEKLRVSSILDVKCSGGSITHINLEANFPNTDSAWDMLNLIALQNVIYFAFNTRINECKKHHGFVGTDLCPVCGEGVFDVFVRIVGYLRPTRSFSSDRVCEYDTRGWYEYAEALREWL